MHGTNIGFGKAKKKKKKTKREINLCTNPTVNVIDGN